MRFSSSPWRNHAPMRATAPQPAAAPQTSVGNVRVEDAQSGFGLNELLGFNRDICKSGGPKYLCDLANDGVSHSSLVLAEELLRERTMALEHHVPLAVVGAAWIVLRVAGYAHEIGDALVFGLIGPAKVLHANDVGRNASLRQRRYEPFGEVFAKTTVIDEVGPDNRQVEAVSFAGDVNDHEALPIEP
jgi:hypothetical protein